MMPWFWWLFSAFAHLHVVLLLVLLLPLHSSLWKWIFKNSLVKAIRRRINCSIWYIYMFPLCPCFVAFIASLAQYFEISSRKMTAIHMDAQGQLQYAMFKNLLLKAQRNYFISGTAFVLCLAVPMLISLRQEGTESDNPVKTAAKEFLEVIRDVRARSSPRSQNSQTCIAMLQNIQRDVQNIVQQQRNLNHGDYEDEHMNQRQLDALGEFYQAIRNQIERNNDINTQQAMPIQRRPRTLYSNAASIAPLNRGRGLPSDLSGFM